MSFDVMSLLACVPIDLAMSKWPTVGLSDEKSLSNYGISLVKESRPPLRHRGELNKLWGDTTLAIQMDEVDF